MTTARETVSPRKSSAIFFIFSRTCGVRREGRGRVSGLLRGGGGGICARRRALLLLLRLPSEKSAKILEVCSPQRKSECVTIGLIIHGQPVLCARGEAERPR